MSLINQSNQAFLTRLQHIYQKKSSHNNTSMSSCLNNNKTPNQQPSNQNQSHPANHFALNPIKKQYLLTQNKWQHLQQQLSNILKPFKQNLTRLLHDIRDQNKFYKLLQLMRKDQMLSDLSLEINERFVKQNFALRNQLQKLKQTLGHLSKSHRQFVKSSSNNKNQNNPQKFHQPTTPLQQKPDPTIRSIPQNIYLQSKLMKEDQFIQWCDKILMKNKIIITDAKRQLLATTTPMRRKSMMSRTSQYFTTEQRQQRQKNRSSMGFYDIQARQYADVFKRFQQIVKKIQQLSPLTEMRLFQNIKAKIINDLQTIKLQKITCPQFCCSLLQNPKPSIISIPATSSNYNKLHNNNKSQTHSKDKKTDIQIYRDNKQEEYFNRYYKHPSFNKDQIKSVQHTRSEQMNRLEEQYYRMVGNRSKVRYGY